MSSEDPEPDQPKAEVEVQIKQDTLDPQKVSLSFI